MPDENNTPIYKGGNGTADSLPNDTKEPDGEDFEEEAKSGSARKEKSVLQAKLTKLAIQIGYAGTCTDVL